MSNPVSTKIHGNIAVITIDSPPLNAIGAKVRKGIIYALDSIETQAEIAVVVLTATGKFFSAGADITEFGAPRPSPNLQEVIKRLEHYHLPTIAALNGTALGGGLELALGCRYRSSLSKSKLGLPEVNLGLIPGAGGTQRLPRLIGTQNAAEIICYGKQINAQRAKELGLVDCVFDSDLIVESIIFLRSLLERKAAGKITLRSPFSDMTNYDTHKIEDWLPEFKARLLKKFKGQLAPINALCAIVIANFKTLEDGLDFERARFSECMESKQRTGLTYAFFAERKTAKLPQFENSSPQDIHKVGVLGAGTMGIGISLTFALAGYRVYLYDINEEALRKAQTQIGTTLDRNVEKGRMSASKRGEAQNNLQYHTELTNLKDSDLVIEAVVERMDVKKSVFEALDALLKPNAVLASNTSYLDINEIASVTSRPEKVLGMHFFSPANIMKLLEVIKTDHVSNATLTTILSTAKTINKVPVISGMCDGFIGNRIFKAYRKQAEHLVEDGALPQDVDRVLEEFGFAMGPFAVSDLAGLDIGWHTRRRENETRPEDERYTDLPDRLYDLGRWGQKTGAGWYNYETGSRTRAVAPEVEDLILSACSEKGIKRRIISDEEIRERILFAMINEGAKILHEGIAANASDIDVVYLLGYGFPRHRGGPMFYADQIGTPYILDKVNSFAVDDPGSWVACPLLESLAATGANFHNPEASKT